MNAREEIEARRLEIDRIDDSIVDLLARRARCAIAIGRAKRLEGTPVRDLAREAEVIARLKDRARGKLDPLSIERVWERIMELSRRLEEEEGSHR
jgi:chorismate mutase/prephenate dehydratase